jgi:hypothetical protein
MFFEAGLLTEFGQKLDDSFGFGQGILSSMQMARSKAGPPRSVMVNRAGKVQEF